MKNGRAPGTNSSLSPFLCQETPDHGLGRKLISSTSLPFYRIQAMRESSVGMHVFGWAYAKRLHGRGTQSLLHAKFGRLGSHISWTVRHMTSETSVQVEESSRDNDPKPM